MKKKEVATVPPMQLRIPPKMKERISASADKSFRTLHSEILYRLDLLEKMEDRGEIII